MAYEYILAEEEAGRGDLTLNRPEMLNAMSGKLSGELHDAVKRPGRRCHRLHRVHRRGRPSPRAATSTSSARTTAR